MGNFPVIENRIFLIKIIFYSISPFDIFFKEITLFGVTVNPYSFQPAIGLMEAMGSRLVF